MLVWDVNRSDPLKEVVAKLHLHSHRASLRIDVDAIAQNVQAYRTVMSPMSTKVIFVRILIALYFRRRFRSVENETTRVDQNFKMLPFRHFLTSYFEIY